MTNQFRRLIAAVVLGTALAAIAASAILPESRNMVIDAIPVPYPCGDCPPPARG